jgi:hypothetical protein
MGELLSALISSLSSSSGTPTLGDYAMNSFKQTGVGRGLTALNQDDATAASVFEAARVGKPTESTSNSQPQALQQGVVGAQQPTYTQPDYMGGIPSLLQGYGNSSQGLLPLIGTR